MFWVAGWVNKFWFLCSGAKRLSEICASFFGGPRLKNAALPFAGVMNSPSEAVSLPLSLFSASTFRTTAGELRGGLDALTSALTVSLLGAGVALELIGCCARLCGT